MLEAMKPFAESRMMEGTSKFQRYLPLHFTTSTWGESITTTKCTSITRPLFCLDASIVNAHILRQVAQNHPNLTLLQFRIELIKGLIGEFSSSRHTVQHRTVQSGHWPVKMSKSRCKWCLKDKKTTFCRMGCELCGLRFCLDCFKNHNTVNL